LNDLRQSHRRSPAGPGDRVDRRTWTIAGIVTLGGIMSNIDTTSVNVALDTLTGDFGASITSVQWVATGYLLALAAVIPLAGWASDRFGDNRVWIASVGLFLAGSMLSGAAWSLESLICFRVLQGIGGGMIAPVGMTLLTRAAGPARVGRVMGILGIQQLLGPVLGPVVGGALIEHAGWRWIFFVNVPIGALAMALGARLLPRDAPRPHDRFDALGFLLISPGMAAIIYGLSRTETGGGGGFGLQAFAPMLLGVALIAAFILRARRHKGLIDLSLFRHRAFTAGVGATFFIGMALFAALFLLPLYYQGARGLSPLEAGLMMVPQGIGAAIVMPFSGRYTDRIGPRPIVLGGLALILAGTLPFALAGSSVSSPLLAGALFVRGMGLGAATMPAMAGAYASFERESVAQAVSVLNVLKRLGGSLGVALAAVVLERKVPGSGGAVSDRAAPPGVVADAFASTFWWVFAFCALAFIPAAFLPGRPAVEEAEQPSRSGARRTEWIAHHARAEA
jgi:EmrB/QacA subfamily drug resistance transporter